MAALVQSFPPQTNTVTMLQTRPTSASGSFQNLPQAHSHTLHASRPPQMQRNIYPGPGGNMNNYRGQPAHAPVAPYAFTATPGFGNGGLVPHSQHPHHLRLENRALSAPVNPYSRVNETYVPSGHQRFPATGSVSTTSSSSSDAPTPPAKDEPPMPIQRSGSGNVQTIASLNPASPSVSNVNSNGLMKPPPDRYRRAHRRPDSGANVSNQQMPIAGRSASPSGSGMATVGHLYGNQSYSNSSPSLQTYQSFGSSPPIHTLRQPIGYQNVAGLAQLRTTSVDDMHLYRQPHSEQAKRYRRRTVNGLEAADFTGSKDNRPGQVATQHATPQTAPVRSDQPERKSPPAPVRPGSAHSRRESSESTSSARSNQARQAGKRESGLSPLTPLTSNPVSAQSGPMHNDAKAMNASPRSPPETNKRLTNPSPLSRPLAISPDSPSSNASFSNAGPVNDAAAASLPNGAQESSAAQQLSAINEKPSKKGGKSSRLRRAFSFGSAAELRKASAENNMNNASNERARLRKEKYHDEQEAEQAAIAQKQEEGGIGESIYSGQGNFFTGSTDNLSISSTASSASIMIRKMGKGMKKSTRSLVGLFRPKSVVGVPAADGPVPQASQAQISMVTVEAEREKVNVNIDPHDQVGGGTGFPKLERNSIDAAAAAGADGRAVSRDGGSIDSGRPRRSIVGGDRERADILAAVKKGILKRTGTDSGNSSPVTLPIDAKTLDFNLPNVPQVSDSPVSSAPSTPRQEVPTLPQLGHRRTDSVTIEGEDYFMSLPKFGFQESKSAPGTPQSMAKHNVNFSPRIQFHDTWTSGEYDRRGEIATCNRLTPMLAQQIKEELNTFKMEMEVHEHSKVYTHFF